MSSTSTPDVAGNVTRGRAPRSIPEQASAEKFARIARRAVLCTEFARKFADVRQAGDHFRRARSVLMSQTRSWIVAVVVAAAVAPSSVRADSKNEIRAVTFEDDGSTTRVHVRG